MSRKAHRLTGAYAKGRNDVIGGVPSGLSQWSQSARRRSMYSRAYNSTTTSNLQEMSRV
ncbi:hypothetical protein FA13DRAFT_1724056 [Coprinellus micaceus]|uniref:Uncharacterized protein n=1 Tax=Coprinellus micaceus TaxID=71717 RepID=A0A4Y7U092_COPMI|nr:hypothetical protein FA13DRAFT_1724056 [Coprinellus micaceus]